jgi:putative spermidine/putrescine transport system permease protein
MRRSSGFVNWERLLLLAPVTILLLLAFALPLLAIVPEAFGGDAAGRFMRIFGSPVYLTVIWTTVRISLEATAITKPAKPPPMAGRKQEVLQLRE